MRLISLLLCGLFASSCAHEKIRPGAWRDYQSVGIRVESRIEGADIEAKWLRRIFNLKFKKTNLFSSVVELKEGVSADLHVIAVIVRIKRWGRVKLFVDLEFREGKTGHLIGRRQVISLSGIRPKDSLGRRNKAAGQIAVDVANKALYFLRERRRRAK